jgi:hypothetical protein
VAFENGTVLRVAVKAVHKASSDAQVNTVHYDNVQGPAGDPNGQDLADHIRDVVLPPLRALYASTWSIEPVIVMEEQDPLDPLAAREEWVSGVPTDGTRVTAGELLPRATCVVARMKTNHIGRRHTGRMFIGSSFDESDQADGQWLTGTGHWTSILAYINSWPLSRTSGSGDFQAVSNMAVYSRTQRGDNLPDYVSHVVSFDPRTQVHWLRSREP